MKRMICVLFDHSIDGKKTVRSHPKIKGCEIKDPGIHKEDVLLFLYGVTVKFPVR